MAKLCGFIGRHAERADIQARLQSMTSALVHDQDSVDEYVIFPNGGIALVEAATDGGHAAWNKQHDTCLALCGHVVGLSEEASSSNGKAAQAGVVDLLLHAFEQHGAVALETLNGVFTVVAYDANTQSLTLANDRYGFMPLYYYSDEHGLVFASEVKAILPLIPKPELDWESCADFFYINHMMGARTLFKHVHALDAAQVLTYGNGRLHKRSYYDFTQTPVLSPEQVSTEKVAELFTSAVARRAQPERTNTVLLSGGFDSRFVLGALADAQISPNIVTIEGARERGGVNGKYALLVANVLRLDTDFRRTHKHFSASQEWLEAFYVLDGMVPNFGLGIVELYPELDSNLGTVWDGLALDVALGGSHQVGGGMQRNIDDFVASRNTNRPLLQAILAPRYFRTMDRSFTQRLRAEIAAVPAGENQFTNFLLKHRTRRRIAVNPYQLYATRVRPMTPAADNAFMEYVLGIPTRLKLHHHLYAEVLKQHFPRLSKVPIVSGSSLYALDSSAAPSTAKAKSKPLQKPSRRLRKLVQLIVRLATPRRSGNGGEQGEERQAAAFIASVIETSNFERPLYNTWLLRRLFARYRQGDMLYHRVFTLVFYIELWHQLFLDNHRVPWLEQERMTGHDELARALVEED